MGLEDCTLQEAQHQQLQGFVITSITLTCPPIIPLEHTGNGHDRYIQPQRGSHLTNPHFPSTIRLALRRTLPPKPRHTLPTGSTEPYAPPPPESGYDQPPGSKVQTAQPMCHPPDTITSHSAHIPNGSGFLGHPPQLLHGAGHHILHRIS